ncbi:J domain-containing protein [Stigmatella aurantiaca]|uniref:DnaJ domain protein n=1 Tax=Stigmatella aurantiaca (strain DW4/3-1) TaxID=378806 RepID=Q093M7_STIAD|nr:J domain-containing protein [Stigmatella aurantiaca]ADO72724.1 DnaJ domain protein [Stigmatella aurantiaca DW4/3-1]EAU66925.1 DnaJ domain protein [Stigmatella aurantiaca DW4/3-1]
MNPAVVSWQTLENVEVECTHCGVRMTLHEGSGRRVKYFRCGSCHRWVSSTYTDIFRSDAKMRTHPAKDTSAEDARFLEVKDRLDRWLNALEEQDPYRVLGVSPLDSAEVVRTRYRELALERHPDRGGSVEKMRELNGAYEKILRHRQRKRAESMVQRSLVEESVSPLPARSR